jgi:hypothetical protein
VKGVPRSTDSLRAKIEDRLGYEVTRMHVQEVDFARRRTQVDVRFRTDRPVAPRRSTKDSTKDATKDATKDSTGAVEPPEAPAVEMTAPAVEVAAPSAHADPPPPRVDGPPEELDP